MTTANSLHKKKKNELVELAEQLQLSIEGKKEDIESRCMDYLNSNATTLANNPQFQKYFPTAVKAVKSPSTGKRKSVKAADLADAVFSGGTTSVKRSLSGTYDRVMGGAEQLGAMMPTTPSTQQVSSMAVRTGQKLSRDLYSMVPKNVGALTRSVGGAQKFISKVSAVDGLLVSYEGYLLLSYLVPMTHKITLGKHMSFTLPDLTVFFSLSAFWYPFVTWLGMSLFVPLIVSYLLNFTTTRKRGKAVMYDPVTFAVAKSVFTFAVVKASWTAPWFSKKVQTLVVDAIGSDVLFAAGVVALIFGFYDAVL